MGIHKNLILSEGAWVRLNDGDVDKITFQNTSTFGIKIAVTNNDDPPAEDAVCIEYASGQGEIGASLALLFPGMESPQNIWALSLSGGAVAISHA